MLRPCFRKIWTGSHPLHSISSPPIHTTARRYIPRSLNGLGDVRLASRSAFPHQRNTPLPSLGSMVQTSAFHSTPPNQLSPLAPFIVMTLKASTTLEIVRTAGRIALTLVPVLWVKNYKSRKKLEYHVAKGYPVSEEKTDAVMKKIRNRTILFHGLLFIPIILFWATILASLERTPLTGRWRLIILSPEEEDDIAEQLAGTGWYTAVNEILSEDGPPQFIAPTDWRYAWVRDTLRRLEQTIPTLQSEQVNAAAWLEQGPDDNPLPPPADHPLKPRPRAADSLRQLCNMMCHEKRAAAQEEAPHAILGPPYSLLVVDKPDASNAFSYGFGPNGGGGIVVYSGFLNDVLSRVPSCPPPPEPQRSWLASIFFPSTPKQPLPTAEQTSALAILLAHELAHLLLSHHLESLSSGTVFVPGTISLISDIVRVLIFPLTMFFGPFVNDGIQQLGKLGSGEFVKIGEHCTSMTQEIEADVVSARLLAHAGFDARDAVEFWKHRSSSAECAAKPSTEEPPPQSSHMIRKIMGSSHPISEVRVERLKSELVRWRIERLAALHRLEAGPQDSHISLLAV